MINGRTCGCPQGKVQEGSMCVSQCKEDELLDSNGNCFTCGANQIISNGQCICATGYVKNHCGVCTLSCGNGQFPFQGGCAICPLNTVFKAEINGCGCPDGEYKNNFGVCEKLILRPVDCPDGQYFDDNKGCVTCPGSCKTCSSASKCLTCATAGYAPNQEGKCTPKCGDGLIIGAETCDTGNSYSSGCINCQIQQGYTCTGQPSICRAPRPPVTPTPTPNPPTPPTQPPVQPPTTPSNPALYQSGNSNVNTNNVFITLKTNPTFTFNDETERQNFLKTEFASGPKPTVYCSQRKSPALDTFDCLLIYPSGVPNNQFSVRFWYKKDGVNG